MRKTLLPFSNEIYKSDISKSKFCESFELYGIHRELLWQTVYTLNEWTLLLVFV